MSCWCCLDVSNCCWCSFTCSGFSILHCNLDFRCRLLNCSCSVGCAPEKMYLLPSSPTISVVENKPSKMFWKHVTEFAARKRRTEIEDVFDRCWRQVCVVCV